MADRKPQSASRHLRWVPLYHFFAVPVLFLYILWTIYLLIRYPGWGSAVSVVVALALAVVAFYARVFPLAVQDRLIRLEETLRLERLLDEGDRGRIHELRRGDFVGLRFASDEEVPDLCRRIFAGELKGREQIKKAIRSWRPDHHRC